MTTKCKLCSLSGPTLQFRSNYWVQRGTHFQQDCGGSFAKGLPAHHEAVSREIKASEKTVLVVDGLRCSRAGVNSDDEFEEGRAFVSFQWFSEIHSMMGGRPSVTPPAQLDAYSSSFRSSDEQASKSTSRTIMPTMVKRPYKDPERIKPGNPVGYQPQQSTPIAAEPPENSSGQPEPSSEQLGLSTKGSTEEGKPRNKR